MIAPDRVAFTLFGLDVMWYGLLIGFGFLLATLISYKRAPKHGIEPDFILDLIIWEPELIMLFFPGTSFQEIL